MSMHQRGLYTRDLHASDLNEVMRLEQLAHPFPWSDNTMLWALNQSYYRNRGLFRQHYDQLVGLAIFECVHDSATLMNIAILPKQQGEGLGRLLLHDGLLALPAEIERVFLEVRVSNLPALSLYLSEGFIEVGYRKGYYPAHHGREDGRVLQLDLLDWRANRAQAAQARPTSSDETKPPSTGSETVSPDHP